MRDGSFGRSAGGAMGRGILLIVAAVALGFFILKIAGDEQTFESKSGAKENLAQVSTSVAADSNEGGAGSTASTVASTTIPPATPATTKVLVANGSDVKGAARRATDLIAAAAFQVATPTDATVKPTTSIVYFALGFEAMAKQVATKVGISAVPIAMPTPLPVADLAGSHVLVLIGPDVAPRFAAAP
ncbi:MAG: LytR C-terminal domain-containing protein [Acidimicrobiales bacterium]